VNSITYFLQSAIFLEPVSIFFYTWRFLATLEREEGNKNVQCFYRWFARISVCILPTGFYIWIVAMTIDVGKGSAAFFNRNIQGSNKATAISEKLR